MANLLVFKSVSNNFWKLYIVYILKSRIKAPKISLKVEVSSIWLTQ